MADVKISELNPLTEAAAADVLPIVDVSGGGSGTTLKITVGNLSHCAVSVNTDQTTVTVDTRSGYYINQHTTASQAVTYNLPTAVVGMQFCFKNGDDGTGSNTGVLTIHPTTDAYIELDGHRHGPHKNVYTSTGAAGDMITLLAISTTQWSVVSYQGSWNLEE